jgi:hypothetical protein
MHGPHPPARNVSGPPRSDSPGRCLRRRSHTASGHTASGHAARSMTPRSMRERGCLPLEGARLSPGSGSGIRVRQPRRRSAVNGWRGLLRPTGLAWFGEGPSQSEPPGSLGDSDPDPRTGGHSDSRETSTARAGAHGQFPRAVPLCGRTAAYASSFGPVPRAALGLIHVKHLPGCWGQSQAGLSISDPPVEYRWATATSVEGAFSVGVPIVWRDREPFWADAMAAWLEKGLTSRRLSAREDHRTGRPYGGRRCVAAGTSTGPAPESAGPGLGLQAHLFGRPASPAHEVLRRPSTHDLCGWCAPAAFCPRRARRCATAAGAPPPRRRRRRRRPRQRPRRRPTGCTGGWPGANRIALTATPPPGRQQAQVRHDVSRETGSRAHQGCGSSCESRSVLPASQCRRPCLVRPSAGGSVVSAPQQRTAFTRGHPPSGG